MKIYEIILQQGTALSEDPSTKMFLEREVSNEDSSLTKQQSAGKLVWDKIKNAAKHIGVDKVNSAHNARVTFIDDQGNKEKRLFVIPQEKARLIRVPLSQQIARDQLKTYDKLSRYVTFVRLMKDLKVSEFNKIGNFEEPINPKIREAELADAIWRNIVTLADNKNATAQSRLIFANSKPIIITTNDALQLHRYLLDKPKIRSQLSNVNVYSGVISDIIKQQQKG